MKRLLIVLPLLVLGTTTYSQNQHLFDRIQKIIDYGFISKYEFIYQSSYPDSIVRGCVVLQYHIEVPKSVCYDRSIINVFYDTKSIPDRLQLLNKNLDVLADTEWVGECNESIPNCRSTYLKIRNEKIEELEYVPDYYPDELRDGDWNGYPGNGEISATTPENEMIFRVWMNPTKQSDISFMVYWEPEDEREIITDTIIVAGCDEINFSVNDTMFGVCVDTVITTITKNTRLPYEIPKIKTCDGYVDLSSNINYIEYGDDIIVDRWYFDQNIIARVDIYDHNGCVLNRQVELLTAYGSERSLTINAAPGSRIELGADIPIDSVTQFTWSGGMTKLPHEEIVVDGTEHYKLVWVDDYNCEHEVNYTVTSNDQKVFIPNAFSPDGDGINDYLKIHTNRPQIIKSISIFDRWGNRVMHGTNINSGDNIWDGRYKGQNMQPGVYVYIIEMVDEYNRVTSKRGSVNLIR